MEGKTGLFLFLLDIARGVMVAVLIIFCIFATGRWLDGEKHLPKIMYSIPTHGRNPSTQNWIQICRQQVTRAKCRGEPVFFDKAIRRSLIPKAESAAVWFPNKPNIIIIGHAVSILSTAKVQKIVGKKSSIYHIHISIRSYHLNNNNFIQSSLPRCCHSIWMPIIST